MADETAAAEVAAPAEAPAAPAAAEAPANESFEQAMNRLGGFDADPDETAEETEEAPAVVTSEKGTPAAAVAKPGTDEVAKFKEQAKKLGFEVDGSKVSVAERAEFRDWKRKQRESIDAHAKTVTENLAKAQGEFKSQLESAQAFQKACASGDFEGMAKAAGFKDWSALQDAQIAYATDPNIKRTMELEKWKADQEAKEVQRKEHEEKSAVERKRSEARQNYVNGLSAGMAKSDDKVLAAFHDDPWLLNTIFAIQEKNFDGQQTLTPEQALKLKPEGGGKSLYEHLETLRDRVAKAFPGQSPAQVVAAATAKPPKKAAPRTDVAPGNGVEAGGKGKWKTRADFIKHGIRMLEEADD